jgi:hypothetical protein
MAIGGASAPDPFPMPEAPTTPGYRDITGRVLQYTPTVLAGATVKTSIFAGQSLYETATGTVAGSYNAHSHMLDPYSGGFFPCADPGLGPVYSPTTGKIWIGNPFADRMIAAGKATDAVVCGVAVGGSSWQQWDPGSINSYFLRLSTAILRCRARGLEPDAIFFDLGITDAFLGTPGAAVTANITAVATVVRAAPLSCNAPIYINRSTMNAGVTSAAIQTAIANSLSVPLGIKAGYDCDANLTVAGGFRNVDGTHLSDTAVSPLVIGLQGIAFP